ncbi:MAG: formate dehydrogenase, partial [Acidimicrobiia bacterium]|nr:formate dehydrogenase [Acidimicrobiia bacterium]
LFSVGGNFLEVLPEPDYVDEALGRIPLRVHMDIVVSTQMLTDPADTVVLLPATTRYEMVGGCTETSTERRVIFSPEIEGPRIEEARPEWQVFGDIAARVRPELAGAVRFAGTPQIRDDIARTVPTYEGIQHLVAEGDQFQYGGPHLCWQWVFPTPDGKAHFTAVDLPQREVPDGWFVVATRRGKQFNSMVHDKHDPFSGAGRESVLIGETDAARLGLADGDPVLLRNGVGEMAGRVFYAPIAAGTLQVHWPEAEVLIDRRRRSPEARIPDYNAVVELVPVS